MKSSGVVARIFNLPDCRASGDCGRVAECNSAIRQIENLRYPAAQNGQLMPAEMKTAPPRFNFAERPPLLKVASPNGMNCAPR